MLDSILSTNDGSPGPAPPPMLPGLPNTSLEACQELMLAIVARGIADDDLDYVLSPTFVHHVCYLGLDPVVAVKIKIKYLRKEIDLYKFYTQATSDMDRF